MVSAVATVEALARVVAGMVAAAAVLAAAAASEASLRCFCFRVSTGVKGGSGVNGASERGGGGGGGCWRVVGG